MPPPTEVSHDYDVLTDAQIALVGEARGVAALGRHLAKRHRFFQWDKLNPETIAELLDRLAAEIVRLAGVAPRHSGTD